MVPLPTPVTVPLLLTVATLELAVDQMTSVVTPLRRSVKVSPAERVMSSRLSVADVPEEVPLPEEAPCPSLLTRTMQAALSLPRRTTISVVPRLTPVTTPASLTVAMLGSALVYVTSPLPLLADRVKLSSPAMETS